MNYRSLHCHIDIILRFITDNDIHSSAFTEKWLNNDDHHILSLLNQFSFSGHCYSYFASNRISYNILSSSHGGNVGLLIRKTFKMSSYKCIPFSFGDGLIVFIKMVLLYLILLLFIVLLVMTILFLLMSFLTF